MTLEQRNIIIEKLERLVDLIKDESIDPALAFAEISIGNYWEVCDDSLEDFAKEEFDMSADEVNKLVILGVQSGWFEASHLIV